MSGLVQTGFDYAALPVDAATTARAAAERIKLRLKRTVEDIIEIGRELTAVKADLPHGHFLPWIAAEFEMSRETSDNFMSVYKRFGDGKLVNFTSFKPSILYALSAPSTPEAVIEKAIEKADAGDKVTVADVKQWKEAAEVATQRADEFRVESNERRQKIRELETQIDLLKAQPAPEPVVQTVEKIVEKPVIPPEYASVEAAVTAKRRELEKLNQDTQAALNKNSTVYASRAALQQELEDLTALLSKHKASQREMVVHKELTDRAAHFAATFLADLEALEHAPTPEMAARWEHAFGFLRDAAAAAYCKIGGLQTDQHPPLEGELLEAGAA